MSSGGIEGALLLPLSCYLKHEEAGR